MDTYKQKIPTANRQKNNKDYSFDHVTTTGFMHALPIAFKECIPNMDVNFHLDSFTRLNPMLKPTFGRARVNNRLFFVPMRTIMPKFTQFLESEPYYSLWDQEFGLCVSTPVVTNSALVNLIVHYSTPSTVDDYDISYYDGNDTKYVKVGDYARYLYSVIISLGYKINWNTTDVSTHSALPVLAFGKVMVDWYYPSQYINSSVITTLSPYFENDGLAGSVIPYQILETCLELGWHVAYDDNLTVNAWDRPVAPNNGVEGQYSIPDITSDPSIVQGNNFQGNASVNNSPANGTPVPDIQYLNGNPSVHYAWSVTQYQHDTLKALTDYTTRHRLSGVRAIDRYFSEYGINLSSEIMKRSILLGNDSFNIQFGDVMSHSDTDGAALGDYAGKGIGYGNHEFVYKIGNEFGYLILINTVIPEVGYYQGVNRLTKHKTVLDFWHADFDGLGVQAVAADEVYVPSEYNSALSIGDLRTHVFGFAPRYYEYKMQPSLMTGLFALPRRNADLIPFTFMRDLEYDYDAVSEITHDVNFVIGRDAAQYNRIFYNGKGDPDNFIFIHHFEVSQNDESSPLYDTYDFKEVHEQIEVHTQGAKVN